MLKSRKEYNASEEQVKKTYTHCVHVEEKYLEIRIYRSLLKHPQVKIQGGGQS